VGLAKNIDIYVCANKKGKMDMDEMIFEMGQPNEILTSPEWTEWWVVDEGGLHLEYAPGYGPDEDYNSETYGDISDDEVSETDAKDSKSIVIHVDEMYENHICERWEEVFGKFDYKKHRLGDKEKEIDERYEPNYQPYPIMEMVEEENYLDYLRDAIDKYNEWYTDNPKYGEELEEELGDPEERVIPFPTSDGLILPTPRL